MKNSNVDLLKLIGTILFCVLVAVAVIYSSRMKVRNCRSACKAQYGEETTIRMRREYISEDYTKSVCECVNRRLLLLLGKSS